MTKKTQPTQQRLAIRRVRGLVADELSTIRGGIMKTDHDTKKAIIQNLRA